MELERAIDVQAQFNNILSKARIEDLKEKKKNAIFNTPSTSKSSYLNSPPPNSHDFNYSAPASHESNDFLYSPLPNNSGSGYGEGNSEIEENCDRTSTNQGRSDILSEAVRSILDQDYSIMN